VLAAFRAGGFMVIHTREGRSSKQPPRTGRTAPQPTAIAHGNQSEPYCHAMLQDNAAFPCEVELLDPVNGRAAEA
jgi:hypothetical protein